MGRYVRSVRQLCLDFRERSQSAVRLKAPAMVKHFSISACQISNRDLGKDKYKQEHDLFFLLSVIVW